MKILTVLFFIIFVFTSTCFSSALQPKIGNADYVPETIIMSNGYYQCRYDVSSREFEDESGTRTVYDYSYIELKSLNEAEILAALVENGYSGGNESGIIEDILAYYQDNF